MKDWNTYLFDPKDIQKIIQGANDWKNAIMRLENYQVGINRYDIEKVQIRGFIDDDKPYLNQLTRRIELNNQQNGVTFTEYLQSNLKISWAIEKK